MSDNGIRPFQIGPHRLPSNLILAPMAGVSDRPFRMLCRRFGAALAVAEMVAADTTLWGSTKSVRRLDYQGEPGPIWAQLVGADPAALAAAARVQADLGADLLDLNMGCPAKKVCRVAAGSALLRDEALVGRILEAVVGAVAIPVTLKIRTGWSPQERNAVRIARIASECGIAALTVHGRTRACGYDTPAEYETIRAIRATVGIPLVANGDIDSPARARRVLDYTGADAIMIGRGARGRPWIFRDIAAELATDDHTVAPSHGRTPIHEQLPPRDWIKDILTAHLEELYLFYGSWGGVRIARKHIAWYCRHLPGAAKFRDDINRTETPAAQLAEVIAFFDHCPDSETNAA